MLGVSFEPCLLPCLGYYTAGYVFTLPVNQEIRFLQRVNFVGQMIVMTVRITRLCHVAELSPETSGAPDGNRLLHQQRQHHHTHTNRLWLWDWLHGASNCHVACLCGLKELTQRGTSAAPITQGLVWVVHHYEKVGCQCQVFEYSPVRSSLARTACVREGAWRSSSDQSSGDFIRVAVLQNGSTVILFSLNLILFPLRLRDFRPTRSVMFSVLQMSYIECRNQ